MDIPVANVKLRRVGFLLVDGFALMSYAAAIEPMRAANLLAGCQLYELYHLPAAGGESVSSSGARIPANTHIGERVDYDMMLVIAGGDPLRFDNSAVRRWLHHLNRRGVLLGGVSGGPAILATAGLMEGRRLTVHWEHALELEALLPRLIIERSLYVRDRDRITCAGGTAALDMMHALLTEHHGARFAREVSDWFMHTEVRPSEGPQRAGIGERYRVQNAAVLIALEAMDNHLADPLELGQIARIVGIGKRQLNRLFVQHLGASTMNFYRSLRLEKSLALLRQTSLSVHEVALATGFAGSAHFSTRFRQHFDHPPTAARKVGGRASVGHASSDQANHQRSAHRSPSRSQLVANSSGTPTLPDVANT